MKIKEETIKELNQLPPYQLSKVYDFIQAIKKEPLPAQPSRNRQTSYLRAREILKKCSGSLADDIAADRDDRV